MWPGSSFRKTASKISRISRLFGVALAAVAFGQAQTAPHFEVVSIKPAALELTSQYAAGKLHTGMSVDGARVDIGSMTLADLICVAYQIRPYQLSGPDWMTANRFNLLLIFEGLQMADVTALLDTQVTLVQEGQAIGLQEFTANLARIKGLAERANAQPRQHHSHLDKPRQLAEEQATKPTRTPQPGIKENRV
jgi:hypothetical protein